MHECVEGGLRLLVGVDFSETSGRALREARRLGALLNARVDLIHVLSGPYLQPWVPGRDASAWLDLLAVAPDEIHTRAGRPWSELARAAEEQATTAIVMGSHGVSGYQPLTLGSTASRVTLVAPCPVVIVSPRSMEAANARRRSGSQRVSLTP